MSTIAVWEKTNLPDLPHTASGEVKRWYDFTPDA
jgi:hypothetical protein